MSRREKLEQMLVKQPEDPFLHYGLAMELVKEGKVDAALEHFDQTLQLDTAYTAAYYHKANTLVAQGRTEEAKKTLGVGVEMARTNQDFHAAEEMQNLLDSIS